MTGISAQDDWIRKEIQQKKITQICHFTRVKALRSIKEHGIRSSRYLQSSNIPFTQSDESRWDGLDMNTCYSVQFPNVRVLNAFIKEHKTNVEDWVILLINPEILYDKFASIKFCETNAAYKGADLKYGKEGFKAMFANQVTTKKGQIRRNKFFHLYSTTDLQAEILLNRKVTWDQIKSAIFFSESQSQKMNQIDPTKKVFVSQNSFDLDYIEMQRLNSYPDKRKN